MGKRLWLVVSLFCVFFSYSALHANQKSVAIFTYKVQGMEPWDPDSIKGGINGSEEAAIYISQKLAKLGYKVFVLGDPPKNSVHALQEANPRFVSTDFNDGSMFDIAISWRMPWNAETLKKRAHKVYLWPHDTCSFPVSEAQINGFDDVLWLSEWQRKQWISTNPGFAKFTKIFGNGINPEQFRPRLETANPHSCVYGSNYARGLEILIDIWPKIKKKFPNARLDVYYGWRHWGLIPPEKEAKMREQIKNLASLDVHEHGQVGHDELNRAYENASIWAYPCIGLETFCITGLRTQLAGALPVIIEGSALEETVRHGFKCVRSEEYCDTLMKAMEYAEKMTLEERKKMGDFILQEYTWEVIAKKWSQLFESTVSNGVASQSLQLPSI